MNKCAYVTLYHSKVLNCIKLSENSNRYFDFPRDGWGTIIWICIHTLHFNIVKCAVRESCRTILIICPFRVFRKFNYLKIQCTRFLATFQKLFQNSSVRVPLRLQKFFKSKFCESFSKSRVYVYSYLQKTFLKVSFLKESLSKNVYVYRDEHMFEK